MIGVIALRFGLLLVAALAYRGGRRTRGSRGMLASGVTS